MRRSIIASTAFAFLLVFFAGAQVGAQRRARRPSPTPATGTAATAAPTPDPQKPKPKAKLTPLSSSDAGQGSRVTITSTDALNNYSAYRSGDRFYVSIPNADAGAVRDSVRGKGFSDTKVQKRGDEVVLSFKLQPGASARVNQRFNRLDVVFTAPGDAGTPTNNQQSNASTQQRPSNTNAPAATNTPTPVNANVTVSPGAIISTRPTPAATPATSQATNDFPIGGGLTDTVLPPTVTGSPLAAPSPAVTSQIAQAQPPTTTAPVTTAPVSTTNAPASGTPLSVTLLRNWPVALIALLLLAGVGLFITTRRSAASRAALRDVPESPALPAKTEKTSAAKLRPATTKTTTATTTAKTATTEAALPVTPPATASSATTSPITTPLIIPPPVEEPAPARSTKSTPRAEQKKAADEKAKTTDAPAKVADEKVAAAAEKVKADLLATKDIAPLVPVDAERVQVETKRLLEGQSYNKMMIGSADMVSRQMVAAELLSALAGRNAERRERARAAFIEHGYFNDTAHDLHFAEAPAERASAARSLGLVGDRSATSHLVASLDDPAMEVRRTTVEALAMLKDPAAIAPLEALRDREKNTKVRVPARLIKHAIDACATVEEEEAETPTLVAAAPPVETPTAETASVETAPVETTQPVVETPQPVEASTVEAPVVEAEQPVEETPTLETQPAQTTPAVETTDEAVAVSPSIEEQTAIEAPAVEESTAALEESAPLTATVDAQEAATVAEEMTAATTVDDVAATVDEVTTTAEEDVVAVAEEDFQAAPVAEDVETESWTVSPTLEESQPASASETFEFEPVMAEAEQPSVVETDFVAPSGASETPAAVVPEAAPFEMGAESGATQEVPIEQEVSIEPVTAPPSSESAATTDASRREASISEWVELDMDEAESALLSTPNDAFTRGFSDFDAAPSAANESTSIDPFEFEKAIDRAPGADAFAPTVTEKVAPEDLSLGSVGGHAPLEELTPTAFAGSVAPAVEEKSVVPASEDYSTVPKAIQLRLASDEPEERAVGLKELSRVSTEDAFNEICASFDDPAEEVRSAAARSLYDLREDRAESFTHALRDAPPERRRKIGAAISSSGLAGEAIGHLTGESRDKTYEAFSLLFLMAKAGEVQPLIRAIEGHQNNEVRLAVVKLLALSGQADILPAFRRLAVRGSLPPEVRTAVMEAIYQISSTQQPA